MSAPHIPQELIDRVLTHLHNDARTLRICALVARCFLPFSQRLIFSRIYLDTSGPGLVSCQKLRAVFLHNPHLIEYAESLYLHLRSRPRKQINILPDTLTMFSHLRSFQLSGSMAWEPLQYLEKHAIRNVFSLPSLASASVTSIRGFPLAIFTRCSQLTHLSFNDIVADPSDPAVKDDLLPQPTSPKHKGQLIVLSGGEGESGAITTRILVHYLAQPHSSLGLSSLQHFTAAVRSDEDVTAYQKVIDLSRRSMESLSLSVNCDGEKLNAVECLLLTRPHSICPVGVVGCWTTVKSTSSIHYHI